MATTRKMITIPHNGPIYPKGGIMGPITTPFSEDLATVGLLLMRNVPVTEHLANGEQVVLTVANFDQDHSVEAKKAAAKEEQEAARRQAQQEAAAKAEAEAKEKADKEAAEKAEAEKEAEEKQAAKERQQQKNKQSADNVTKK